MAVGQGDLTLQLDSDTQAILDRQLHGVQDGKQRPPRTVFAFATSLDIIVIIISSIAAIIAGALNPLLTIIYGQLAGSIQGFSNGTLSGSDLRGQISKFTLYYVYLAIACFVFIYVATVGFYWAGERITHRLRKAYLKAVMRQNMAFFDNLGAGEVTTRITSDTSVIQEGITSKISLTLTAVAAFVTAFVVALIEYWRLALILSSIIVAITITGSVGGKTAVKYSKQSAKASYVCASIAEEAINSIRHVTAFGLQDVFATKYDRHLAVAERSGVITRIATALTVSVMMTVPYFSYGLAFWQGSRYLVAGQVDSAAIITTTFAILIGAFALGRIAPNAEAFVRSIASASAMLQTIARQSPQDPFDEAGLKPVELEGQIRLENLSLVYPSRPDVLALDNISLTVPAGKTTAIVGASGCGKSSIVGLLQRFYEPSAGTMYLDKNTLAGLNLRWLREQISCVAQEPVLFDATIRENIALGLRGHAVGNDADAIDAMTVAAARTAHAHDFIVSLPLGYETVVGQKGLQLSGGQRQRIALARALIGDPKILLLDEATSSLDSRSEKIVQKALDLAAQSRTTIMIAHRLSTVRNADNIVVMSKGRIVEQGGHKELMQLNGFYAQLVAQQAVEQEQEHHRDDELDRSSFSIQSSVVNEKTGFTDEAVATEPDLEAANTSRSTEIIKAVPNQSMFSFWDTIRFILQLNRQEWRLLGVALLCCFLAGVIIPVQSVFLAEMIKALSYQPDQYKTLRSRVNFWSLMFLMIAIVALIAWIGQGLCFSVSTEKLTRRARHKTFCTIMRQQIAFFDEKEHSAGAMTALLSTSTTDLNSLNGAVLGNILTFMSVLICGLIIALIIGWKLALVCATTIPIVAACGWIRLRMLALFDSKVRKSHQESATYASEVVVAIRVVASFGLEDHVLDTYGNILSQTASKSLESILKASALYAMSQSFTFLCSALGYWYGGTLIASHEYTLLQFFICYAALVTGSQIAGSIFSYAPDISKAMHAAYDLASLFKRQPDIDVWSSSGEEVNFEKSSGRIEIEDVSFRYPSRHNRVVLSNFNLVVHPGQFVALVGASGCGKSTVIALLERFYNPDHGKIKLDGRDISRLNLRTYRSMISLVGQEPTVYMGTIKENILLGSSDNVTEARLIDVCKAANIYDFIISLPAGFDTDVGARGNLLSGGQKQRIAIARALLRDPKVLLLDEATSALDSESEKLVQAGLDAAAKGRTTIAIAHRLSTVQRADVICVVDGGKIVEQGTHNELMARRGQYYELVQMQMLEEGAKRIEMNGI